MNKVQIIEKALASPDTEERRLAVLSLKGRGLIQEGSASEKELIGLLLKAMQDQSWRVRKTAQDILLEDYEIGAYMEGLIGLLYIEDNAGARNAAIETLTRLDKLSTPYLIDAFDTPNADVRKFILDVLGQFKDKRALPLMLSALRDEDENVRSSAVEHLGAIGDESVVDALIEILEEGELWTAYPAAEALGRIGDSRALPALIRALKQKTLREPAIRAIGRIGDETALKEIVPFIADKSKIISEEAIRAIETLYHRGVPEDAISKALRDEYGDKSVELLLEGAWNERPEVRIPSILILGLMKDERALKPLLELSSETDFAEDVKRALVYIGRNRPECLLPLFEQETPHLRRFICAVAADVAAEIYFDMFVKLLNDSDGHVRAIAAHGLANIGDIRAIPALMNLLTDEYEDVQEAAIESLSALKNGLDIKSLISLMSERSATLRKNIALLLGAIATEEALPTLGFALKDENPKVRRAVVSALTSIKTEDSVRYLMVALTDEDPDIRAATALSVGALGASGIGEAQALESLSLLLTDPDSRVKVAAARALGMLGNPKAVLFLVRLLSEPNGFVVTTALSSIGKLGGQEARDALISMLTNSDKEIRRTAIMALSSFPDVEEHIIPFLADEDWATRAAAVEVLGPRKNARTKAALEEIFEKEEDLVVRKTLERYIK